MKVTEPFTRRAGQEVVDQIVAGRVGRLQQVSKRHALDAVRTDSVRDQAGKCSAALVASGDHKAVLKRDTKAEVTRREWNESSSESRLRATAAE